MAGEGTVPVAIVIAVALGILFAWAIDEATKAALTPGLRGISCIRSSLRELPCATGRVDYS